LPPPRVNRVAIARFAWLFNNRGHRKLMVIDGRVAFTAGININISGSKDEAEHLAGGWRAPECASGPAVTDFQRRLVATGARLKGEPLAPRIYFPALSPAGGQIVRVVGSELDNRHGLLASTAGIGSLAYRRGCRYPDTLHPEQGLQAEWPDGRVGALKPHRFSHFSSEPIARLRRPLDRLL